MKEVGQPLKDSSWSAVVSCCEGGAVVRVKFGVGIQVMDQLGDSGNIWHLEAPFFL